MKRILLSLAMLVGISLAGESVNAEKRGGNEIAFATLEDARFRLSFNNTAYRSRISIRDESGRLLYDESVARNNDYMKIFDFSTLGDGRYTLEVSSGKEKISKPFEISSRTTRSLIVE